MFRERWMMDNGLSNVMDLIKRQRWVKLFKRRELIHIDAVKEFYARLTLVYFKKKEVTRSQVRGVDIEFDNFRLASTLGIPGNNGICEYIKDGKSGSDDQFFDAEVEVEEPVAKAPAVPNFPASPGDSSN
ncbi:hypothetical protein Dimus_018258 [Dionaea muscipula]